MNVPFQQGTRTGRLTTQLKGDPLMLRRFSGADHMNGLFEYGVQAITGTDVNFDSLIGTHATVTIETEDHGARYFDGIVTTARWSGVEEAGHTYELVLRPWFWLAGRRRNQRIFHEKSVVEIIDEVLRPYGGLGRPHLRNDLSGSYPTLEYTVQYRESDLAFVCRLMERFGINYHFEHSDGNHAMVLSDTVESLKPLPGKQRRFQRSSNSEKIRKEHFWEWAPERNLTTGAVRLTDYNFKHPSRSMEVDHSGDAAYQQGQLEAYDYPGGYGDQSYGDVLAGLRTAQERGQDDRRRAVGDVVSLSSGMTVVPEGKELPGKPGTAYLCLSATHAFVQNDFTSGSDSETSYSGSYVLMPSTAPFVPERRTHVPTVGGPQTAVVVGEGEIDCDEYGRILVHFHWDLAKAYSMRCRVSQNWASKGWGGMVIPRIGMEVVVEFLEGDPDKPLVTGCVYNGKNDPPYALPGSKTKSVFRTDTHQGGGYNELTFEDERDAEEIYMRGQKDHRIEILNDRRKDIGRDQTEDVGRDKSIAVGRDHAEQIGQDARHTIARDVIYKVGQNQQEQYGKDHVHVVGNIFKQDIYADHLATVGRDSKFTVSGKYTLDVTNSITTNTGKHTLMAFEKFVIKGPGGKITIDGSGITLEAAMINLKGNVSMGGSGSAQVPTLQGAANEGLPLVEECVTQKGDE